MTAISMARQRAGTLGCRAAALLAVWLAAFACPAAGAPQTAGITALVGPRDAVLLTDAKGSVLLAKNADTPLVPASTLKILTSLVALHYLGEDHRFVTRFYRDDAGNLKVAGAGDPLLTSESLLEIATALAAQPGPGVQTVADLVIDASYYAPDISVPGRGTSSEPYDAPLGAFCANFNTVAFRKSGGAYESAELQTPLLPSVMGAVRASGLKSGRITLSHRDDENTRYAGELLLYFLKARGVEVTGRVTVGRIDPARDREIYRYESPYPLTEVIAQMLDYSNNFIANQLLLAAGATAFGPPGTLSKGVRAAESYCRDALDITVSLVEGSGLSRRNRLSARQLDRLLRAFEPYRDLMRFEHGEHYKTGSLNGVRTRAGYLETAGGGRVRFVVMYNTPGRQTGRIMERIRAWVMKR